MKSHNSKQPTQRLSTALKGLVFGISREILYVGGMPSKYIYLLISTHMSDNFT